MEPVSPPSPTEQLLEEKMEGGGDGAARSWGGAILPRSAPSSIPPSCRGFAYFYNSQH